MFNSTVYFQVILPSQPRFWFQPLFPILLQPLGGQSMPEDLDREPIFIWQILQLWKHLNPTCQGCELFHPSLLSRHFLLLFSFPSTPHFFFPNFTSFLFYTTYSDRERSQRKDICCGRRRDKSRDVLTKAKSHSDFPQRPTSWRECDSPSVLLPISLSSGQTKLMYTAGDCNVTNQEIRWIKLPVFFSHPGLSGAELQGHLPTRCFKPKVLFSVSANQLFFTWS